MAKRTVVVVPLVAALLGGCGEELGSFDLVLVTHDCRGQVAFDLKTEASEVVITISAPDLPQPIEVRSPTSSGEADLGRVPVGTDRVATVHAYNPGDELVASGRSAPFEVTGGASPQVTVVLRPVNKFLPTADLANGCTTLRQARAGHSAARLPDGRILLAGGFREVDPNGRPLDYLADVEIFDPATGTFSAGKSMCGANNFCLPRALAPAITLQDGRVMLVGGESFKENTGERIAIGSAAIYDPAQDAWSLTTTMTAARRHHTATLLSRNGHVVVVGGMDTEGNVLSSTEYFDPAVGRFFETAPITALGGRGEGRAFHAATAVNSQALAIAGGVDRQGQVIDVVVYLQRDDRDQIRYKLASQTTPLAVGVFGAGAGMVNDRLLLVGGSQRYLAATGTFDGVYGEAQWLKLPNPTARDQGTSTLKFERAFPCVAPVDGNRVLVVGGLSRDRGPMAEAEMISWDGDGVSVGYVAGKTSSKSVMGARRAHATCTPISEDRVLITGGIGPDGRAVADAEVYVVRKLR